jgi:hypothetical protein
MDRADAVTTLQELSGGRIAEGVATGALSMAVVRTARVTARVTARPTGAASRRRTPPPTH